MYGTGQIDSSDVLLNRGLNGSFAGFGAVGFTPFSGDGSAVNANVRGNRDIALLEGVNRNAADMGITNTIVRGNEFLTDRINQQFMNERFSSLERLLFANHNDAERRLQDIQLKQVECCCELRAAIAAVDTKVDNLQSLNAKDAEIALLRTQLLFGQNGGPGQGN